MRFTKPSNKEAEYEAVLHGMRMVKVIRGVPIFSASDGDDDDGR
jgi:hypothetical protein